MNNSAMTPKRAGMAKAARGEQQPNSFHLTSDCVVCAATAQLSALTLWRGICDEAEAVVLPGGKKRLLLTEEMCQRLGAAIEQGGDCVVAQAYIDMIHGVEQRCMAADGPVTPTHREITDAELIKIYKLAVAALPPPPVDQGEQQ